MDTGSIADLDQNKAHALDALRECDGWFLVASRRGAADFHFSSGIGKKCPDPAAAMIFHFQTEIDEMMMS